jgi:hypothetical protein
MAKNRKNTIPILIDIRYALSINSFEEFYGDCVTYAEIEQESYIDLKSMVFEKINSEIKFRKFNREKNTLTVRADMLDKEFKLFKDILEGNVINHKATKDKKNNPSGESINERFSFFHNWKISSVKIMTKEDLLKCKKVIQEDEMEELENYSSKSEEEF